MKGLDWGLAPERAGVRHQTGRRHSELNPIRIYRWRQNDEQSSYDFPHRDIRVGLRPESRC